MTHGLTAICSDASEGEGTNGARDHSTLHFVERDRFGAESRGYPSGSFHCERDTLATPKRSMRHLDAGSFGGNKASLALF